MIVALIPKCTFFNNNLDEKLKNSLEYQKPINAEPRVSFQRYENLELNNSIRGYCGAWS